MAPDGPNTPRLVDLWSRDEDYRRQFQAEEEVEQIVRLLDLGRATALLDAGCGNGTFSRAALRQAPHCRVWAVDALDSAVAACREAVGDAGAGRFQASVGTVEAIDLPGGAVDRVLCRAVLHHVARPASAYREFARVLRPGGMLLLQAPVNAWEGPFGAFLRDLFLRLEASHERQYHTPADVIAGLSDAGLSLRRAECWPYDFPYITAAVADFIRSSGHAERLRLRQVDATLWSVQFHWLRVWAERV